MNGRVGAVMVAGVITLSVAVAGCSGDDGENKTGTTGFSRSEADGVVDVTGKDFSYVGFPPSVKGPKVFFEMTNEDPMTRHELEVMTSDGKSMGAIPRLVTGETNSVALNLPPGRYFAQCMVRAADTRHADLGMMASFSVE